MKPKGHILVVEDKSLIYKRLKMILEEHQYSVEKYAPSVDTAIGHINKKRPDLALLDIHLKGEHNGIYLGNLLKKEYKIPFIYVTDFDDDETFYEGLNSKHNDFISKKEINLTTNDAVVIQTKPHLDEKRLIRAIKNVLMLQKTEGTPIIKDGLMAYVNYIQETIKLGNNEIKREPVLYEDILYITRNTTEIDINKINRLKKSNRDKNKEEKIYLKKLKSNYARIYTLREKSYYLPNNLAPILKKLPYNFVRVSDDYIINLDSYYFDGRINGKRLKIKGEIIFISDNYREEVEKRISHFYQNL